MRNLNLGEVCKINVEKVKCICGKAFGPGGAFCAACGMFSCSIECHQQWEKLGFCKFSEQFYSVPEGFTMRSMLFENIRRIQ